MQNICSDLRLKQHISWAYNLSPCAGCQFHNIFIFNRSCAAPPLISMWNPRKKVKFGTTLSIGATNENFFPIFPGIVVYFSLTNTSVLCQEATGVLYGVMRLKTDIKKESKEWIPAPPLLAEQTSSNQKIKTNS